MKRHRKFKNIFKSSIAFIISVFMISEMVMSSFSYALGSSGYKDNVQVVQSNVMDEIISDKCGENCSHVYRDLDDNLQPICKKGVEIINNKKRNIKRAANGNNSFAGQGIYLVKIDDATEKLNLDFGKNKIKFVDAHFILENDSVGDENKEKVFRMYKIGGTQEPTFSTIVPDDINNTRYNRVYFRIYFEEILDNGKEYSDTFITNFTKEHNNGKIDEITKVENTTSEEYKYKYQGNIKLTSRERNCLYLGRDIYKTFWSGSPAPEGHSLANQLLYIDNRKNPGDESAQAWKIDDGKGLYLTYRVKESDGTYSIVKNERVETSTSTEFIRYYKFPSNTKATERSMILVSNKPLNDNDQFDDENTEAFLFLYNTSDVDNCLVIRNLLKEDNENKYGLKRNFVKYSPEGSRYIRFRDRMNEYVGDGDILKYKISTDGRNWSDSIAMKKEDAGSEVDKKTLWKTNDAYSKEYKYIKFIITNGNDTKYKTDSLLIDENFSTPTFFVDVFQKAKNGYYGTKDNKLTGCWVRSLENSNHGDKNSAVEEGKNKESKNQKYIAKSTFYDYYSDFELKGNHVEDMYKSGWEEYSKQAGIFNYAVDYYYRNKVANGPYNKYNAIYGATGLSPKIDGGENGYINRGRRPKPDGDKSINAYNNQNINSWQAGLHYASGIVDDKLNEKGEMTQGGSDYIPQFNEAFLRGDNILNTNLGAVYPNVDFSFRLNKDGYWEFDSLKPEDSSSKLKLDKEEGYYLERVKKEDGSYVENEYDGENGFFPFDDIEQSDTHNKNHLFGMKMSIPFRSTKTGTIKTNKGSGSTGTNEQDVIFKFTGDDDLWLFIDDKLALDLGGIHDAITGEINFNTGDVVTYIGSKKEGSTTVYQENIYQVLEEDIIAKYGDVVNEKTLKEYGKKYLSESEHKLNIFYMERGLAKSNLRITFNFPTKNMLSVSNDIDVSAADDKVFGEALKTLGGINYFIKNQVTVGEPLKVENSAGFIGAGNNVVFDNIDQNSSISVKADNGVKANIVDKGPSVNRQNILEYIPSPNMLDWADKNTIKKYLVSIKKKTGNMDISKYAYLKFDVYNTNETSATGTELYVQLTDTNGNSIGDWASNLTYKSYSNTLPQNEWASERISIKDLKTLAGSNVDFKNIASIDIGYSRNGNPIYFDDFKLYEEMVVNDEIGFSIQDRDISDYKSLENLNPIDYSKAKMTFVDKAWYMLRTKYSGSNNYNEGVPFAVENGMFGLANGQKAEFVNKFRLGTYIQLEQEDLNKKIFDTTWTLKEEDKEINSNSLVPNKDLETVRNDGIIYNLNNNDGYNVNDGRTVIKDGTIIESNAYDSDGKKKGTFVFRRFDNPDDKGKEGVNLNIEYKNTLKVGGISLKKVLSKEAEFDQKFRFHIHYRNVAGRYLEENIDTDSSDSKTDLVQTIEITVPKGQTEASILIKGIPAGTSYTIHEMNNIPLDLNIGSCYKYEFGTDGNLTNVVEPDEDKKHCDVKFVENEKIERETVKYKSIKGIAFNSVQEVSFKNEGYKNPNGAVRITKKLSGTTYTKDKDFTFHVHYTDKEGKMFTRNIIVTVPAGKTMGTTAVQNIPVERNADNKRTFGAPYWIHEVDESNLTNIEEGKSYKIGTLGEDINKAENQLDETANADIIHTNRSIYLNGEKVSGNENIADNKCENKTINSYAAGVANTSQKEYIFTNSGPVSIAIKKSNQEGKPLIGAGFSVYKKENNKETFIKEVRTSYYERKSVPNPVPNGEIYDNINNRYNDGAGSYIVYEENKELYYYKQLTPGEIADYEEDGVLGETNANRKVEALSVFENLEHGEYKVDETTIPSGYRKVDTKDLENIKLPKSNQGTEVKNVNDAIFSVINYDKYILPRTGKGRILKWIALGMVLVAIGAGFIILKNKKEEGDN